MKIQLSRLAIALTLLLSGLALVPFVQLPGETFSWHRYAGADLCSRAFHSAGLLRCRCSRSQ